MFCGCTVPMMEKRFPATGSKGGNLADGPANKRGQSGNYLSAKEKLEPGGLKVQSWSPVWRLDFHMA